MKSKFIIICLLFAPFILSQEKQEEIKESVKDFFDTVKNYTQDFNASNKEGLLKTHKYSDEEIESLLYKYYKAKAEDPVGFYKYQENEDAVNKEHLEKSIGNELSLAKKVGIIYKILSSKYGRPFVDIINVPYYLKVKILNIKQEKFESSIGLVPRTKMVVEIDEILKGEDRFRDKNIIEINFLNFWMRNTKQNFEINKEYFVGLIPWNCYNGDCGDIALQIFSDGNYGIYPIENNNIITKGNLFQFGEVSKWSNFRNQFEEKFIMKGVEK